MNCLDIALLTHPETKEYFSIEELRAAKYLAEKEEQQMKDY